MSAAPWPILAPVRGRIGVAMALSGLSAVLALASLVLIASAVARLLVVTAAGPWLLIGGAAGCTLAAIGLRLAAFGQSHRAAFRLELLLRRRLAAHVATLPMGRVQQVGAAAIAKVMQDDVKALHVFVADATPLYARAVVMPAATAVVLAALDWRLAAAALAVAAAGIAVMAVAMRDGGALIRAYHAARERVSAAVIEFVQAMPVVRTFDSGHASFGRYQRALDAYLAMLVLWYRRSGLAARASLAILAPLPTLAALLAVGLWTGAGDDQGRWLAALLTGTGMAEAMMPAMALRDMVARAGLAAARIAEIMAEPAMAVPDPASQAVPQGLDLCFQNVGFRYAADEPPVIEDLSVTIPAGSVTALVGPSGAGKSTIAALLCRFHDVTAGRITIGGVDLRDLPPDRLAELVGFVFQDSFLFAGSIADNIRLGRPDAPMTAVIDAARAARAHEFIIGLPQGYDTRAGDRGVFLSGGERQRITIARALLLDRPILVLDEPTAFADAGNEAALMAGLAALMHDRTVIVVAHRLSTIRDADRILVLDHGRLVEAGSHEALLDRSGLYARLWRAHERARGWTIGGHRHGEAV
ncbi:lipoprotein inner membrane ABC transporter [Tistrella bauzanensis]|uniref:Lipoprotein inner membrane ABC transporter n=1 Tax=Tistrella bauzanensis TaxID=657419 RepID=A0ABQ1IZ81_9PROT|nr:ABC transporter ATP-binding protein [Tistrella bauzanensis]GGB54926.1 lipoprotein inner membrane ABC transporter [Tistrella bauzanensis]